MNGGYFSPRAAFVFLGGLVLNEGVCSVYLRHSYQIVQRDHVVFHRLEKSIRFCIVARARLGWGHPAGASGWWFVGVGEHVQDVNSFSKYWNVASNADEKSRSDRKCGRFKSPRLCPISHMPLASRGL